MKVPQLRKKPETKSCHNITWEDDYSWIPVSYTHLTLPTTPYV